MAIFNSYVKLPEATLIVGFSWIFPKSPIWSFGGEMCVVACQSRSLGRVVWCSDVARHPHGSSFRVCRH